MKTHPFPPQISKTTKKLLIGTLPPEDVIFYFSNSSNTRLWDILTAIKEKRDYVGSGGNSLSDNKKIEILDNLQIGISDIIYAYERDEYHSTKDSHIDPKEYNDLLRLALDNNIQELLFVYQSALKWFIHSLAKTQPVRLNKIRESYTVGKQQSIEIEGKILRCTLLPPPLNRGTKGQTLDVKLATYRKYILEE
jgi:G:T/U-mismatch repair DNA glycosylase